MSLRNSSDRHEPSARPPPEHDYSGAVALAVLAAAAFGGWYILGRDLPADSNVPAVVQTPPIIPPATTDTAVDLPGHEHYTVFVPKDQPNASKSAQGRAAPSKP